MQLTTLPRTLALRFALCLLPLLAGAAGILVIDHQTMPLVEIPQDMTVSWLSLAHGCWSGPAPVNERGRLPGGVIYSRGTGVPTYSSRPRLIGVGINDVLVKPRADFRTYAFCK